MQSSSVVDRRHCIYRLDWLRNLSNIWEAADNVLSVLLMFSRVLLSFLGNVYDIQTLQVSSQMTGINSLWRLCKLTRICFY